MKRNRGKLAVARSRTQDTSGLSRHAVFCHWAMTTRQLPTLTILYMYCTGGTECFSRTPSSHSAGAIRTLLGVDRKFLSPPGKNPCWVVFSLQMLRASGLRISKFALLSAWGKMLWTLYKDVDGKMKCLWIHFRPAGFLSKRYSWNLWCSTVHWPCAWVHHSSTITSTVTPCMMCAEKEHLHKKVFYQH